MYHNRQALHLQRMIMFMYSIFIVMIQLLNVHHVILAFPIGCQSFTSSRSFIENDSKRFEFQAVYVSKPSSDDEMFAFHQSNDDNNLEDASKNQKEIMDEIAWRRLKLKLEEDNIKSFQKKIKSRPWKLPYEDARKWVQANLGAETEEEFYDLVANGNLRTPYIPKQPEEYYTISGTWISWNHFLNEKC